jgi:regulator of protease activity HflC (stomatin/prohibitin superfamily)
VPLLLFGVAAMLATSMVVLVTPSHEAIVLTWGKPPADHSTLKPGMHFKWFWPVQTADVVETDQIRSLPLGVGLAAADVRDPNADLVRRSASEEGILVYVWNKEHGERRELDFLVPRASSQAAWQTSAPSVDAAAAEGQAPPVKPATAEDKAAQYSAVGTVRITATLLYRVVDPYRFRFGFDDTEKLLSDIAQHELTDYAARHDIDTLMSARRDEMDRTLYKQIDRAANEMDLGVEVLQVSLGGLHPPTDVAEAFEEVIKANHERQGKMLKAQSSRDSLLSEAAGSAQVATALATAAARIEDSSLSDADRAAAQQEAWGLLDQAGGKIRQIISRAQATRWKTANHGRGLYLSFQRQLAAWQKAPEVYELNELLRVYHKAMDGSRKYILGVDPSQVQIWQPDDRRSAGGVFAGTGN